MTSAGSQLELSEKGAFHLARERKVVLESATLLCDSDLLTGVVRVQNIAYEKRVVVRYTLNNWESFSDLKAVWNESVWDEGRLETDRFSFSIPLPTGSVSLRVKFAISYDVAGFNFWDNNGWEDYELAVEKSWRQCVWSAVRLVHNRVRGPAKVNSF